MSVADLKRLTAYTQPGRKNINITPNNNTDLTSNHIRALWIGVGGNVAVQGPLDGSSVTFQNVPNGTLLPIEVVKVLATGTTATGIIGII